MLRRKLSIGAAAFAAATVACVYTTTAQAAPHGVVAFAAGSAAIEVKSDRITLRDVSPTAPRELLNIDIAPAPAPGKAIYVSREAIRNALRRAGAQPALANGLPSRQRVRRAAVELTEADLSARVIAAVAAQLPLGVDIGSVVGIKSAKVPTGEVRVDVRLGRLRRATSASISVFVDGRRHSVQTCTVNLVGQPQTPTLRSDLPRGAVVGNGDVTMTTAQLERLPQGIITRRSDLVGKRLTQPGRAGRPIQRTTVKPPPLIERGASIYLVAVRRGLKITRRVIAAQDGMRGETIRVRPITGDKRTIQARVHSATEVRIELVGAP